MPVTVLLADDSKVVRAAIAQILQKDPRVELLGQATCFAETLQLTASLKPNVLLLDLHMNDEREYPSEVVKSQVTQITGCILAMSLWNDEDAKTLADSFGARVLLDKTKLFSDLIPAIMQFCPDVPPKRDRRRRGLKPSSDSALKGPNDAALLNTTI